MPTLEDLRSKAIISGTPAADDLLPYFDVDEFGNGVVKKTTVTNLASSVAGLVTTSDLVTEDSNGLAAVGELGETRQSLVAASPGVALTSEVGANLTSISLTPGDWDVEGSVSFAGSAGVTDAFCSAAISTTPAVVGSNGQEGYATLVSDSYASAPLTRKMISIAATTTVYLATIAVFSTGTLTAFGGITARRVR